MSNPITPLTREERETIINFNQAEDLADVYTMEPRLLTRLRRLAVDRPDLCVLTDKDERHGSESYSVPKKWVKISAPANLSDERRDALRLRGQLLAKRVKDSLENSD